MTSDIVSLVWYLSNTHSFSDPILEIGSRAAVGQWSSSDLRKYFPGKSYWGVDQVLGHGVDQICDAHHLPFPDGHYGTVLCFETLEHVANPLQVVQEVRRVMRGDGKVIFSTQHYSPIHQPPCDYFRFTTIGMFDIILNPFRHKHVLFQGDPKFALNVVGLGSNAAEDPFKINLNELSNCLPWNYPYAYQEFNREDFPR